MSNGGLSDKKLIIYVSSSRGPGAEGRLGHSLETPSKVRKRSSRRADKLGTGMGEG